MTAAHDGSEFAHFIPAARARVAAMMPQSGKLRRRPSR